jgi:AraC-like DNA-binding protein
VRTLESPREAAVLGPLIVREIVYRVLSEPEGIGLRAVANGDNRFSKMSRILRRIHADCAKEINVAELAKELHMGLSAFHQSFKAITSTSPIQYVKAVRLHKARYLMAYKGMKASEAAYEVGYMSSSQFNREFKRLFGMTPQQEISRLREQVA